VLTADIRRAVGSPPSEEAVMAGLRAADLFRELADAHLQTIKELRAKLQAEQYANACKAQRLVALEPPKLARECTGRVSAQLVGSPISVQVDYWAQDDSDTGRTWLDIEIHHVWHCGADLVDVLARDELDALESVIDKQWRQARRET